MTIAAALAVAGGSGTAAAFTPASLFASSEEGAWYDPSDLSTLFQDAAGTTPVTADGDPVGLMLDKSQGLVPGSELVTNGTFDADLTGWTVGPDGAGWSVSGGRAYFNDTERAGMQSITQNAGMIVGRTYEVTFEYEVVTGSFNWGFALSSVAGGRFVAGSGIGRIIFTVTDSRDNGPNFSPENINGLCQFFIDNISVRELPGNHASQSTAAKRPIYRTAGGLHWLEFDGVDDFLRSAYGSTLTNISRAVSFRVLGPDFIADDDDTANAASFYSVSDGDLRWAVTSGVPYTTGTGGWVRGNDLVALATAADDRAMTLSGSGNSATATSNPAVSCTGATLGAAGNDALPLDGRIYGFVDVGRILTAAEQADLKNYLAAKAGVTL